MRSCDDQRLPASSSRTSLTRPPPRAFHTLFCAFSSLQRVARAIDFTVQALNRDPSTIRSKNLLRRIALVSPQRIRSDDTSRHFAPGTAGISPCRKQFAAMVSTRHHPRQFPEPDLSPTKTPSSRKSTTRSEPTSPVLGEEPTTTIAKTPKPRARKSTSTSSPLSLTGYTHSPPIPLLAWLVVSLPLVGWDTLYVLFRPHTMPGGKFHSPFWTPYALYGTVDYVRSMPLRAYLPYFLSLSTTYVSDNGSSLSHWVLVSTHANHIVLPKIKDMCS
jgi:hypothetical protein